MYNNKSYGFNSIMVQLERANPCEHGVMETCFNSIKVQLERLPHRGPQTCFNSIKVQLERAPAMKCSNLSWFQFHKGSIRTCTVTDSSVTAVLCFNSIKVQLERTNWNWVIRCWWFQFHKGSIRTEIVPRDPETYTDVSIP